jgi:hypothetical protein
MLKLFCAIFLAVAAFISSSWIGTANQHRKQKFLVTGSIRQTVSYCGGAEPTQQILDSCNTPRAVPYAKLFVKLGKTNVGRAAVIETIKADAKGNFSVRLPPGSYCLVEEWKSKPFKLPAISANKTVDSACLRNLYNTCDYELKITKKNISHVEIIFHRTCSYNQPCISYRGPLPPKQSPRPR